MDALMERLQENLEIKKITSSKFGLGEEFEVCVWDNKIGWVKDLRTEKVYDSEYLGMDGKYIHYETKEEFPIDCVNCCYLAILSKYD